MFTRALLLSASLAGTFAASQPALSIKLKHDPSLNTAVFPVGYGCPPKSYATALDLWNSPYSRLAIPYNATYQNTTCCTKTDAAGNRSPCDARPVPVPRGQQYDDQFTFYTTSGRKLYSHPNFTIYTTYPNVDNIKPGISYYGFQPSWGLGLYSDGVIPEDYCPSSGSRGWGYYAPPAARSAISGEWTLCEPNASKFIGDLHYASGGYLEATLHTSVVKYGNKTILDNKTHSSDYFFNTRTAAIQPALSSIIFPEDVFEDYVQATGAIDKGDGNGYTLTPAQFKALQPIQFTFECKGKLDCLTVTLIPDAQIRPRKSANDLIKLVITGPQSNYLVNDPITHAQRPYGIWLGNPFLERYYTFFNNSDPSNLRIGLARTNHTFEMMNY